MNNRGLKLIAWLTGAGSAFAAIPAYAQYQTGNLLIDTAIPVDFDKGRNVSVTEKVRPDYDPLGIRTGTFVVFPQVTGYAGITDNVLLQSEGEQTDGFVGLVPAARIESDWSRHQLRIRARADLQRYFSTPRRNQNAWELGSVGKIEVHSDITVTPEIQLGRVFETPFSGGIQGDQTVLSSYFRTYGALRASYQGGQFRATAAVDRTSFDFSSLDLGGTSRSQRDRDRVAWRTTGQLEYALSPSASLFSQIGYERVNYDELLLTGEENRSSKTYRVIGGINMDLAGLLRGSIGFGYMKRDFDASPLYKDLDGVAAQAKVEYFPSELTTFTLTASRTIEDSNIQNTTGYLDNRFRGQVDHELLRNLILTGNIDYSHQKYIGAALKNDVFGIRGQARYRANRMVNLTSTLAYTKRNRSGAGLGTDFDELRFLLGITLQR